MGKIYNKAIRDKIPDIIKSRGDSCEVKQLSDSDFLVELERKLREELEEYYRSKSPEELADMLEIIYKIGRLKGLEPTTLEGLRKKKAEERGGFDKNLFLVETKENAS